MNISSWRRLILTVSGNEMQPSATATGHLRDSSCHSDDADSPQIPGCLFQENNQSFPFCFGFFPRAAWEQLWCPPEPQEFSDLIGEVERRDETLTSRAPDLGLAVERTPSDRTKDERTSGRSAGARAECEWR